MYKQNDQRPDLKASYYIVEYYDVNGKFTGWYNPFEGHGRVAKIKSISVTRADGKPDIGGDPSPEGRSESESTTDNYRVPKPERATVDNPPPSGIRPL